MSDSPTPAPRRLLVNGERLTERVDRVRGGGDKFDPQPLAQGRTILVPQLARLAEDASRIPDGFRTDRVVFETRLLPNYLANSDFPASLLARTGLTALGSKKAVGTYRTRRKVQENAPTKTLILAGDDDQIREFRRLLTTDGLGRSEVTSVEEILRFDAIYVSRAVAGTGEDAEGEDEMLGYEAVLHPDPVASLSADRRPASAHTLDLFAAAVESVGGQVRLDYLTGVGGLSFVPMMLPRSAEDRLLEFNPLRTLRRMPRLRPLRSVTPMTAPVRMAAPEPAAADAPEVLVFDGGADDRGPVFAGSVISEDLVTETAHPDDVAHGEAVTSIVLYGAIDPARPLARPVARVRHLRVTPGSDDDVTLLPRMLQSISDTMKSTSNALVNLSLGPEYRVDDDEPHPWTAELDRIAYEHGATFVVAPGNNGAKDEATGMSRIQVPGDIVNGITVGSADRDRPATPVDRAPYSPIGPGRGGAHVQPAVVAFGGTETDPINQMTAFGDVINGSWGTSFAAPRVTHALAGLRTELAERSTAPTLRAFTIHCAERGSGERPLRRVGFGRALDSFDPVLSCDPNQATVLYQGSVARDEVRAFYLPVPQDLTKGDVTIHVTLAFTSPTDPSEAAEYTKAALEHWIRPHALKFTFTEPDSLRIARGGTTPRSRVKHVVKQRDDIDDLLLEGWTQSLNPHTATAEALRQPEFLNRDKGKWENVWDATKTFKAASLYRPRLDLNHITRSSGQITSGGDDIDFSLLVTVTARKDYPLYERVAEEFSVLAALPTVETETPLDV